MFTVKQATPFFLCKELRSFEFRKVFGLLVGHGTAHCRRDLVVY
jgi:hypothetical protein